MRFRNPAYALLLALLLFCPALVRAQTTTVFVVRHAEKLDNTTDPPLSDAGRARAQALATALAHARIEAIYVTQYARSRQSATPLAEKLGLTPEVVQTGGDVNTHAAAVAERIRSESAGRAVLVIGHSNTVPAIVKALSGVDIGAIPDPQYDDMLIIQMDAGGARVVRAGYPPF